MRAIDLIDGLSCCNEFVVILLFFKVVRFQILSLGALPAERERCEILNNKLYALTGAEMHCTGDLFF